MAKDRSTRALANLRHSHMSVAFIRHRWSILTRVLPLYYADGCIKVENAYNSVWKCEYSNVNSGRKRLCVCISIIQWYTHTLSLSFFLYRIHTRAFTYTHTRLYKPLNEGMGKVCAVRGCNQLQSVGAVCSNQRHKCQLLSPAHASICIH